MVILYVIVPLYVYLNENVYETAVRQKPLNRVMMTCVNTEITRLVMLEVLIM